ncbi:MAG: glutathione peroxidase [Bryobacteraceae bacterium]
MPAATGSSIYDFTVNGIDGKPKTLADYKGKVVMIVNVASKCGFTPQYRELEGLYKKYQGQGFVILGFPANNFMSQEPGTDEEIKTFCSRTYDVTFPMFSKVSVKGSDMAPLYQYLTDKKTNPEHGGFVGWNFSKFLVDRNGRIVDRFMPTTKPESMGVVEAVEKALAEK